MQHWKHGVNDLDEETLYRGDIRQLVWLVSQAEPAWPQAAKHQNNLDPFSDIYHQKIIEKFFADLPLADLPSEERVKKSEFRQLCAAAAGYVINATSNLGGASPEARSRDWSLKVANYADKLLALLEEQDVHFSSSTTKGNDGQYQITFAPSFLRKAEVASKHLRELRRMVPFEGNHRESLPTTKSYYHQLSVLAVSAVFCRVFSADQMKRTVDENKTSGLYNDFVHLVAPPLISRILPDIYSNTKEVGGLDAYMKKTIQYLHYFNMDETA